MYFENQFTIIKDNTSKRKKRPEMENDSGPTVIRSADLGAGAAPERGRRVHVDAVRLALPLVVSERPATCCGRALVCRHGCRNGTAARGTGDCLIETVRVVLAVPAGAISLLNMKRNETKRPRMKVCCARRAKGERSGRQAATPWTRAASSWQRTART